MANIPDILAGVVVSETTMRGYEGGEPGEEGEATVIVSVAAVGVRLASSIARPSLGFATLNREQHSKRRALKQYCQHTMATSNKMKFQENKKLQESVNVCTKEQSQDTLEVVVGRPGANACTHSSASFESSVVPSYLYLPQQNVNVLLSFSTSTQMVRDLGRRGRRENREGAG